MNNKIQIILNLFLFTTLFINVSCNSNDSVNNKKSSTEIIPTSFKYNYRAKFAEVKAATPELKKEIKAFLNNSKVIPSEELIFDHYNNETSRANELKELGEDQKLFLNQIKKNCLINSEKPSFTGELAVGKTQTEEKRQSVSGDNCPIQYSDLHKSTHTLSFLNAKTTAFSGVSNGSEIKKMIISDSTMINKSLIKETELKVIFKNLYENVEYGPTQKLIAGERYYAGNTSQEFQMSNGSTITITTATEEKITSNKVLNQTLINIKIPQGEVVIGIFNNGTGKEYLVNGVLYTKEQIFEEFGLKTDPI